jgi:tetratricopeptide (TPR) repeat protein
MELESLVDELVAADAAVLQHAVTAAAGLLPLEPCRDATVLETLSPPPEEARDALRAVRADVVRARNLERAGRYPQGVAFARQALARAEALGWPPLVAEARLRLGSLLDRTGAYPEAETVLERAYFDASKGVAPEVAFDAALVLAYVVGAGQERHTDGRRWAMLADVALSDIPDEEHLHRAALLGAFATLHRKTGDYDQAEALVEQALALQEAALGPEHPGLASNLSILAKAHQATGDYDQAKALYERALAISRDTLGPQHPILALDLNSLGNVHFATGDLGQAKLLFGQAVAIWEAALGPEHVYLASGLYNLGNAHHATGDYDQAKALLQRSLAIQEKTLDPEHPDLAFPLVGLARVALAQHRPGDARPLAERAVTLREKAGIAANLLAEARFELARALWEAEADAGRDRERARILAEQARDGLRAVGKSEATLATIEAWLAAREHPGAP